MKLGTGTTLWNDQNGAGNTLSATLPNIDASLGATVRDGNSDGAFRSSQAGSWIKNSGDAWVATYGRYLDFSRQNSIYKDNATVRPPSLAVAMFKRTK